MLFIDAPASVDDLEKISAELSGHVLMANMSESGVTPHLSAQEFHDLGFRLVAYPTSALRIAARVFGDFFTELRATGDSRAWRDRMTSLDELNTIVGLQQLEEWESALTG